MSLIKEYTIGTDYPEIGTYLGIITIYPHKKDYVEKVHKFALVDPNSNGRACAKITEIFIESLPRTDV